MHVQSLSGEGGVGGDKDMVMGEKGEIKKKVGGMRRWR